MRLKTLALSIVVIWLLYVILKSLGVISSYHDPKDHIRYIMQKPTDRQSAPEGLFNIVSPGGDRIKLWHLPKRKTHSQFTEITSANRDSRYPTAPDFTFHLEYGTRIVTLYEDHGPGCIYRLYMMPEITTDTNKRAKLKFSDFANSSLVFEIDSHNVSYTIEHVMRGEKWPFLTPINTQHPKVISGLGSYVPMCYQRYMKIYYIHNEDFPKELFKVMVNCSKNDLYCPIHIYSGISRHKYPKTTRIDSFANVLTSQKSLLQHKSQLEEVAAILKEPVLNGPNKEEGCVLRCYPLVRGVETVIFEHTRPGVISSLRFRLLDPYGQTPEDWSSVYLTIRFDQNRHGTATVSRVPLGSLVGISSSLNPLKGAALGNGALYCAYQDWRDWMLPRTQSTGYVYFPMPFWKNVTISVIAAEGGPQLSKVCVEVSLVENHYSQSDTGYFHVATTSYKDSVDGFRTVLDLDNRWGHMVGLLMEVDNLRARRKLAYSQRWAALQADPVLYIDGSKSATMLGTGLEDYFSYGHGFYQGENTSYAFVGVHHASPHRSEPLTWHCYRLQLLDPIPFHKSIQFIMEGTLGNWAQPISSITHEQHHLLKSSGKAIIRHTALYYAGKRSKLIKTDSIHFGDKLSEEEHKLRITNGRSHVSALGGKKFLGQSNSKIVYKRKVRIFHKSAVLKFNLHISMPNKGVILRREYHSVPVVWNEVSHVYVNGIDQGLWFIPMGTLSEEYSLCQEDFMIGPKFTSNIKEIIIEIHSKSQREDISYIAFIIT